MMISLDCHELNMPQNHKESNSQAVAQLLHFRYELKNSFTHRPDAIMNLLDAISSNTDAISVAELSLNPCFGYQYPSLYDGIDHFFTASCAERSSEERRKKEMELMRLITPYLSAPKQRDFWLFCLDVTPAPRPFAQTLADRTCVYQPNLIPSNKPVTYGHQYAAFVHLPEKESLSAPPWVVPLQIRRIQSTEKATTVQAQQISTLLAEPPFASRLCVTVVDSTLSALTFLGEVKDNPHLVTVLRSSAQVARCRSNRVFYHAPKLTEKKRGHPTWYGQRFDLKDQTTWPAPDSVQQVSLTTRRGRQFTVEIQGWQNLLMRGTRKYPMHQSPFTLIRIVVTNASGKPVFSRPLWLIVIPSLRSRAGFDRRAQLSLKQIWDAYRQRYDVEHFFRFGKQRLLTTAYQTPIVEHEENWWQMTQLAYVQLGLARELAQGLPKPWERYLPQFETGASASPSIVQRDFRRIIDTIEPNTVLPKPRGKSPGRTKGDCPKRREKQSVIKKGSKRLKSAA